MKTDKDYQDCLERQKDAKQLMELLNKGKTK